MPRMYTFLTIIVVAIAVGFVVYFYSASTWRPNASAVLAAVPDWAMRFGSPNASMTVIEFFDPLCPYCAVAHYRLGSDVERLVESGHLQLILIPLPLHGNYSMLLISHLYCAYKNGNDALKLLNAWYKALVDYAVNKTESEVIAVYNKLMSYKCNGAFTMDQFALTLQYFNNAGVAVSGTPTFIIIKDGQVTVIEGARVEALKSVLT